MPAGGNQRRTARFALQDRLHCGLVLLAFLAGLGAGRSSGYPVVKPLDGTFLAPSSIGLNRTVAGWETEFQAMEAVGCSLLIIQLVAWNGTALYPTSLPWLQPDISDPIESVLTAADRQRVKVQMGSYWSIHWGDPLTDSVCLWSLADTVVAVQSELYDRYRAHGSFTGWYLAHELGNYRFEFPIRQLYAGFFGRQADWCHQNTGLPCSIAPYFDSASSVFMSAESTGLFWTSVLAQADIDIVMLQDGIGRHCFRFDPALQRYDHVEDYFRSVGAACEHQTRPREFWADVELFSQDRNDPRLLWPGDIDTIAIQLGMAQRTTGKTIGYDFHRCMNPTSNRWPASVYWEYDALIRSWTDLVIHCPYTCLRPCSPSFSDLGQLTDGIKSDQDTALVGWSGTEPIEIDVPLPAACSVAAIKCFFRNGPDSLTKLPDSVQFYSSPGDSITYLGIARLNDGRPGLRKMLLNLHPAQELNGVRVRVFPSRSSQLTLMSEIEAVGKEPAIGISEPAARSCVGPVVTIGPPGQDWLEVMFPNGAQARGPITVYDAAGRKALQFMAAPRARTAKLSIANLRRGVYFLTIEPGVRISAKFTKF